MDRNQKIEELAREILLSAIKGTAVQSSPKVGMDDFIGKCYRLAERFYSLGVNDQNSCNAKQAELEYRELSAEEKSSILGDNIRTFRATFKLTQPQMATMIYRARSTIANLESRRHQNPSERILNSLAHVMGQKTQIKITPEMLYKKNLFGCEGESKDVTGM
jgi:DNA-binding XRE family transcriptional regulator